MPRLSASLLRSAYRKHPLLPLLLRECRDLPSARNELRWLREHALSLVEKDRHSPGNCVKGWRTQLRSIVRERARGKPLQYILGDQPFGDLEILCRQGVLIPRLPETESYTIRTAQLILSHFAKSPPSHTTSPDASRRSIRILDLCSGTGCIPLLLHTLLAPSLEDITIIGIDISPRALALARQNLEHNIAKGHLSARAKQDVQFLQADILGYQHETAQNINSIIESTASSTSTIPSIDAILKILSNPTSNDAGLMFDIVVSNPPYISPVEYRNGTTRRSVRLYEPKLALVPPPMQNKLHKNDASGTIDSSQVQADVFYPQILSISARVGAQLTVMECGDVSQARRVAQIAKSGADGHSKDAIVEIWKCDGSEDYGFTMMGPADAEDDGARAVAISRGTMK
ncbi:hypothetical protein AJ80_07421 [Polytolypa hystricis UAMH7299]|uniref:Methyltransferase domain-containing protein n=1 Tax=Polytolypa hystricis (strain UAMH7299) TaxID=1447883 RepID=A0A2B7XPP7_POLH7|nr:hypothetical protein AJ80_07421 [Polytolypa hystricis UAMH7299]